MADFIRYRRGIATVVNEDNPVLRLGEPCFEVSTGIFKVGDGVTKWFDLPQPTGTPTDISPAQLAAMLEAVTLDWGDPAPSPGVWFRRPS